MHHGILAIPQASRKSYSGCTRAKRREFGGKCAPRLLEGGIKAKALAVLLERDASREPKSASLGCLRHRVLWPCHSHPLLHGAFAVQYVSGRPLPLELKDGVDQHHQAEHQDAGNDDGDDRDRAGFTVQFNHHILVLRRLHIGVDGREVASHEVFEDGARVAGLHPQPVIVELPVLFVLVEVSETCKASTRETFVRCFYIYIGYLIVHPRFHLYLHFWFLFQSSNTHLIK